MPIRTLRSLSVALSLVLSLGGAAPAVLPAQRADTLTVATYAYPGVDRLGAVTPLARHLGDRLGRPVRAVTFPDPPALARAAREGRADVVVTNTFGNLLLADGAPAAALPVATFRIRDGERSNYGTVIVASAGVRSVAELRERAGTLRVALVAPGSTTGNLVPRLWLAQAGLPELEAHFAAVTYGGTHAGTYALLRERKADVVALAGEEYDKQAAADSVAGARVLWRSPDITLGPVAVRATLPAALRGEIAAAAVGLERDAPAAFAALRGGWVEARNADALVAASDATYDAVRGFLGSGETARALIARFAR